MEHLLHRSVVPETGETVERKLKKKKKGKKFLMLCFRMAFNSYWKFSRKEHWVRDSELSSRLIPQQNKK